MKNLGYFINFVAVWTSASATLQGYTADISRIDVLSIYREVTTEYASVGDSSIRVRADLSWNNERKIDQKLLGCCYLCVFSKQSTGPLLWCSQLVPSFCFDPWFSLRCRMTEQKRMGRWYFGGLASAGAACCTHPLDLIKVGLFVFISQFCTHPLDLIKVRCFI